MSDAIVALLDRMSGPAGYLLLAVCAFVENLVPPIPGDTVTVFGGYLAGTGRLDPTGVILVTTAGSFGGFMALFGVGRSLGRRLLDRRQVPFFPHARLRAALGWFDRYGYAVVVGNPLLSGLRSVISLSAGMAGLGVGRVALYCLLSCLAWNALLVSAGHAVGENWEAVVRLLRQYNLVVGGVAVAAALIWAGLRFRKKR